MTTLPPFPHEVRVNRETQKQNLRGWRGPNSHPKIGSHDWSLVKLLTVPEPDSFLFTLKSFKQKKSFDTQKKTNNNNNSTIQQTSSANNEIAASTACVCARA